jgi:hypothetical protein
VASQAASDASTFNPMASATETRAWTDRAGNGSILDASGGIQYEEVAASTSNFGQASGTSRPDPNLARGYNWEYSVSVQHEHRAHWQAEAVSADTPTMTIVPSSSRSSGRDLGMGRTLNCVWLGRTEPSRPVYRRSAFG